MLVRLIAGRDHDIGHGRVVKAGEPMPDEVARWTGLGRLIQLGHIKVQAVVAELAPVQVQPLPLPAVAPSKRPEPPVTKRRAR